MLKRILSGIVLALILIPIVIAGGKSFLIAVGIIAILGFKEFLDLRKSHANIPSGIALFSMVALLVLIFYEYEVHGQPSGISMTPLVTISIVLLFPTMCPYKNGTYETKDAFYLIGVLLFLSTAFHGVIYIRNRNIYLLVYLLLVSITTDVFAFFIGKYFGKKKIFPNISPNKTYAGSIGGAVVGTIVPTLFYSFVIARENIIAILVMSFILSVVTQFGDLLFSKIKRENGIKDFSDLIPGHGGILDRFDSFIFVVLAYMIIMRFI